MVRLHAIFIALGFAASSYAQETPKDKEKDAQYRIRAEGSVGGVGQQLSKEQRQEVNSGARQHRDHREALDTVKRTGEQGAARGETSPVPQKDRAAK